MANEESAEAEAAPDLDEPPEIEGWCNVMDSHVRTKELVAGAGPVAEMHDNVRCSYSVRVVADCEEAEAGLLARNRGEGPEVFLEKRDQWFRIGENEAVPGLELALRNMAEGGETEAFSTCRFAWNDGCPAIQEGEKEIPPESSVSMHVVVHEIRRHDDKPADGAAAWEMRIWEATWRKANGNDHFKRRFLMQAAKSYGRGMEAFQGAVDVALDLQDHESLQAEARALIVDCGANLAAVHLENDNPKECLRATEAVLTLQPNHVKALYRAGCAHLRLADHGQCQECVRLAQEIDPQNVAVKRLAHDLRKAKQRHEANTKAIGKKIVKDIGQSDPENSKSCMDPLQWLCFLKRCPQELKMRIESFSPILWGFTQTMTMGIMMLIIAVIWHKLSG